MKLEDLKAKALKFEEHRYSTSRGIQIQCVIVLPNEGCADFLRALHLKSLKEAQEMDSLEISSSNHGNIALNVLSYSAVTRVSISKKKAYKSFQRKLDEPHPEEITRARRQIEKSQKGELPGIPLELLREKLKEAMQDTLRRRAEVAARKLSKPASKTFLACLRNATECLVTNFHSAPENLWLSVHSQGKSFRLRAKNGVTVIFSSEDHIRSDSKVAKFVEDALADGRVAGDYVVLK